MRHNPEPKTKPFDNLQVSHNLWLSLSKGLVLDSAAAMKLIAELYSVASMASGRHIDS